MERRHTGYILNYANKLAKQLDKKWLELSVLKVNIHALRLYMKVGFAETEEKKLSLILKKSI